MKLNELMTSPNDYDHAIQRIGITADICEKMGNKPILYRQIKYEFYGDKYTPNGLALVTKVTAMPDRKVRGDHNKAQNFIVNKLNIKNPVWATPYPPEGTVGRFGETHIMVPIGNYEIHHSAEVADMGSQEDADDFIDSYTTGWPGQEHGDSEVIVDCEEYYLINLYDFIRTYTGKKTKEIIKNEPTKDRFGRESKPASHLRFVDLNKKMLEAKFRTYNQVAWYLKNPVTNYFKFLEEKQNERNAALRGKTQGTRGEQD